MKYFFNDLFEKINRFSHKIDSRALLEHQHWVVMNEIEEVKKVFIFRPNNELLVSSNGKVQLCKWDYLGYNSILLSINDEHFLYKNEFFDEDVLALRLDGQEIPFLLLNETRYGQDIGNMDRVLEFLQTKYAPKKTVVEKREPIKDVFIEEKEIPKDYADDYYLDPVARANVDIIKEDLLKLFRYRYNYVKQGVVVYQYLNAMYSISYGDRVFDVLGNPFTGKLRVNWITSYNVENGIVRSV
ncbi:hypothetical protein SAMN04488018_12740 [Myroides marinus]|uniref:Uncharacterized protein n=1 Tax=Myroides marinus TaxID=703342 RepID=A0A1H6Y330_9FLAO|nr:hypothetical protein [Myroides marinus]SEJ35689.1 hypothetical protein SAMN04488018_12740 [Myroides marinus]